MPTEWRNVKFMAQKLLRAPYTVRFYARTGALGPGVRKLGKEWMFDEASVDAFLKGEISLTNRLPRTST